MIIISLVESNRLDTVLQKSIAQHSALLVPPVNASYSDSIINLFAAHSGNEQIPSGMDI